MKYNATQDGNPVQSLRKLMFLRLVVVTFLLGVAASIQIKETKSLSPESIRHVFAIIIIIYILSIIYVFLHKKIKKIATNVHIQTFCDVGLITALVYATGCVESVYSVLYQLVIIYSTLFLGRKGGLIAASVASIFYGLLLNLEYYGVLTAYGTSSAYNYSAGYVLLRIFIHIVSFYIVALLVSFVVEKEKKSRSLLSEKETEFDQLDLLYRGIIEHVNAGIVTIDLMGHIKSFNKAAKEISGFNFHDVKGRNIDYVFPGILDILNRVKSENNIVGLTNRSEISLANRQGQDIVLGFSVSSLINRNESRIGDIIIFEDLTAAKQMEREVEKSKNLALIGEMAAGLTHEIRNPLTAMSGSIQLLKKNLDLNDTDARLMQIVLRGRDQLEKLISNFLLLARPNSAARELVDLNTLITDVIESLQCSDECKENITFQKEVFADAGIYGNLTEIKQLLYNLFTNSVQAMPNGGILKIVVEETSSGKRDGFIQIITRDSGYGIDKEKKTRIFTPFFTTKEGGTGLGLAIVNRIVESHGGSIEIESEEGKGTTCTVMLPKNDCALRKGTDSHGKD